LEFTFGRFLEFTFGNLELENVIMSQKMPTIDENGERRVISLFVLVGDVLNH